VAIGNIVAPSIAQQQVINGLEFFLPGGTVSDIQAALETAVAQSNSFGLVALAAIVWSATSLFSNVTIALDSIFDVPAQRSLWRLRLVAVLLSFLLVLLVFASFITSGVLRLLLALSPGTGVTWISIGAFFLPLGLNIVTFALLFRYIPAREVVWDAVWPAALFGAVGWELAKSAFEWYITNLANYSVIYGGIATGIVLLFWAYLLATIFLFSAELCARLNEWLIEQQAWHQADTAQQRIRDYFAQTPILIPPPEAYAQLFLPAAEETPVN
ncbi:MAG: YihY/virulence factor BrkB family protein, partial [Aggregatilineales bacterium]